MVAAAFGEGPEKITVLIDAGADIHMRDDREKTALMIAVYFSDSLRGRSAVVSDVRFRDEADRSH